LFWDRYLFFYQMMTSSAKDRAQMAGPQTISIAPEALCWSSQGSSAQMNWLAFQRIVPAKDHLFIFSASHTAHVIPKRAFPSDEAFRDFCDAAQVYWATAQENARESPNASSARR